jgi:hypothetical protein
MYEGKPFTRDMIDGNYGFIYLITRKDTGRKYIGRKYFIKKNGRKWQESDWNSYHGSSDELKADIALHGEELFDREILRLCLTRGATNYHELAEQFTRDVLAMTLEDGTRMYYNSNIASRYFVSTRINSPEKVSLHKKKNSRMVDGITVKKRVKRL